MTKQRALGFGLVAALAAVGYFAYVRLNAAPEVGEAVRVAVKRGDLTLVAQASGTIEPHMQVEVKSRAPGEVVEVAVDEGDKVSAGQLLVRLDPTAADLAVKNARAAVQRLIAQLAESTAAVSVADAEARDAAESRDVQVRGAELGLVASESERSARNAAAVKQTNVELRRAQVGAARAQLEAARLALQDAERQRRETEILAPFAGTVLSVNVEKGSIASSALTNVGGGSALLTLADLSDLRVIGQIDEAQVGRVKVGQDVTIRVDAYPDQTFEGRVTRVSPLGVEVSNVVTFDVEIVVTDKRADLLRSGMSADLEIVTGQRRGVLLLPLTAVRTEGGRRSVRLPDGKIVPIRTGENDGTRIEIVDGLAESDVVVVGGASEHAQPASGRGLFGPPSRRR